MRKFEMLIAAAAAASLTGCNKSADNEANASAKTSAVEKPKPAYCFFKEKETEGWKATTDKSGNVVVSGRAYRSDPRYKAVLAPAVVNGTTAEVSPTIMDNDTGFASPENWWPVSQTIANSAAITDVTVTCGSRTLAELSVPRRK